MDNLHDYIVVGGGNVGCVIASRLSEAGHNVLLLEAGPESYSPEVMNPLDAPKMHNTVIEYNYKSTPQPALDNRRISSFGGKLLSGSTAVNYGLWTRGHSADYDAWAALVGDSRWSYSHLLKYFRKTEKHHDLNGDPGFYGFSGPISTTAGARKYPLREQSLKALLDSGLKFNPDANTGNPLGVAAYTENWKDQQRQPAGKAYDLSKVEVLTNATVSRVIIDPVGAIYKAVGAELADGRTMKASKEVILSCGAVKTPQLLMLSGVGPTEHLRTHGIRAVVDLPVGQNYHDHLSAALFWKLRNPEQGLALGSPLFDSKPEHFAGFPMEWLATLSIPEAEQADVDPLLRGLRAHAEFYVAYAAIASQGVGHALPFDGTHISTPAVVLLPTSRGTVTLASPDPLADPVIDPNYLATKADWAAVRAGLRAAIRAMETDEARAFVAGETPPEGHKALTGESSDEEIDARVALIGGSFYHSAGTAAMGAVVDAECRVMGVGGLRVCDASILPLPIAAHYQAPLYAVAEAVSEIILGKNEL